MFANMPASPLSLPATNLLVTNEDPYEAIRDSRKYGWTFVHYIIPLREYLAVQR